MAQRVPRRRLYHENWKRGFVQNSRHGNDIAKERALLWVDNDMRCSVGAVMLPNAHGWPEKTWGSKRFESLSAEAIKAMRHTYRGRTYQVRDVRTAFVDAERHGQNVELEVKDIRPYATDEWLRKILDRVRRHARAIFGTGWRKRVNIKVVSTMGSGIDFALRVCRIAHSLNFVTLVSAQGKDRFRRRWPSYVTYVRGSAVPVR